MSVSSTVRAGCWPPLPPALSPSEGGPAVGGSPTPVLVPPPAGGADTKSVCPVGGGGLLVSEPQAGSATASARTKRRGEVTRIMRPRCAIVEPVITSRNYTKAGRLSVRFPRPPPQNFQPRRRLPGVQRRP